LRRVYVARHPTEAHFLKGLLASQGIEAEIRGEALFSARGELPVTSDTCPSVWVLDDSQLDRALPVDRGVRTSGASSRYLRGTWRCSSCGEELEPQFTECWRCGTARQNNE